MSFGDVALNGIRDSRFESAPTGALTTQRGGMMMLDPLKPF